MSKYMIAIALSVGIIAGFLGGKWWYEPDEVAGYEKAHEAGKGLVEDKKAARIVYVDRVKEVVKYVEKEKLADRMCLDPANVRMFNRRR